MVLSIAAAGDIRTRSGSAEKAVAPADMRIIGTVDERHQSYNVEMVEVTGGKW